MFHVEPGPRERLTTVETIGLGWGILTFLITVVLALVVVPAVTANLGDLVAPPFFTRLVLHPAFVLGNGLWPWAVAGVAVHQRWRRELRTMVILGAGGWSLFSAGLTVVGAYLPLFAMAGRVQG